MNIKVLFKSLPLQTNPKKYEQFVRELDYKKMLAEDPVEIRDKYYVDNRNNLIGSVTLLVTLPWNSL